MSSESTYVLHRADDRGAANHGWLETRYSFSFSDWHDPSRMHFGALRVLNDDELAGGGGFDMHPHDNMEIVTIPIEGGLRHKDDMGHCSVIRAGDVQVMSAGRGVMHSEFNAHAEKPVKLFQSWVFPSEKNLDPSYAQRSYSKADRRNQLRCIVEPSSVKVGAPGALKIHQQAWYHLGDLDAGWSGEYALHGKGQGLYCFVIEGGLSVDGHDLGPRDAIGVVGSSTVQLEALKSAAQTSVLLIEVPMHW
jgi:redox-sensitive bicupin YhaK (pirin superfamily)